MTLRIQLLLLALLTLALPWAGCQYSKQMESVLREGQEDSLKTTASTLARVIAADPTLNLSANDMPEYYALTLTTLPHLDGFDDEWIAPTRELPKESQLTFDGQGRIRLGMYHNALHVFVSVKTRNVEYESSEDSSDNESNNEPSNESSAGPGSHPTAELSNNVSTIKPNATPTRLVLIAEHSDKAIALNTPSNSVDQTAGDGAINISAAEPPASVVVSAWSITALAPGPLLIHRATTASPWTQTTEREREIRGVWRASADGFDIEFRIPQKLVGMRMALLVVDQNAVTMEQIALRPLVQPSLSLQQQIDRYVPDNTRMTVLNAQGWLLARAGSLEELSSSDADQEGFNLYRLLLGRHEAASPSYGLPYGMWGEPVDSARRGASSAIWFGRSYAQASVVRAAVPIKRDDRVVGVVTVEQAGERLLQQRDRALEELFSLGLFAILIVGAAVLAFYMRLTWRIRRLSKAAADALGPDGKIEHRLPDVQTRDELGDLARSYATLLHRFNEYAQYLQTLGSKLTHEMRTPLTIVASSLENLVAERKVEPGQPYVERAREGTKRLQTILTAMSEATRVEQSIEHTERVSFDLTEVLRGMTAAYQQTFSAHNIVAKLPETKCPLLGAPDLIAQMLDKLLDNAADYCPSGGTIEITLEHTAKAYRLVVSNQGPQLAPEIADKLFDAMVGNRAGDAKKPHLGLGLFIVQLIARFHRGTARAFNLPDGSGVAFEIELPRLPSDVN